MTNENSNESNRPPSKHERFWRHWMWVPISILIGIIMGIIPMFIPNHAIDNITNKIEKVGDNIVDRISNKIDSVISLLAKKALPPETIPKEIDKNTLCNNDNPPINCLWREKK